MLLLLSLFSGARAGSISAAGVIGGPDAGAATTSPVAMHYNPAALGGIDDVDVLADLQLAAIRIDATSSRNQGIDPNTCDEIPDAGDPSTWVGCENYDVAKARVQVPVGLLGVAVPVLPDRLTLGFAATDAFVGGGDYTAGEPDDEAPYQSHQRYFGVTTRVVTIHLIPAAALTIVDGVHVGAGFKYVIDMLSATQASNLGLEGMGPLGEDGLLEGETTGSHMGWNAGIFFDKFEKAKVGVSYTRNGTLKTEGPGSVTIPGGPLTTLTDENGELIDAVVPADITFETKLPDVVFAAVQSQLSDTLEVGAGIEYQMWGACCSGPDGDILIGITSEDGDPIGADPEDGLALAIGDKQYSPRRLQNSMNLAANIGVVPTDPLWVGVRLGYNQNAVPDFALSATNLDFENVGVVVAGRYQVGKVNLGLTYSKYLLFERVITNSAWGAAEGSPDYKDDRFTTTSPPLRVSANGTYGGDVDIFGVRAEAKF